MINKNNLTFHCLAWPVEKWPNIVGVLNNEIMFYISRDTHVLNVI